ncbi:DegV family protein [Anaerophilus nitritogenes]|uniref:DegV family protein n=1 Tax=Anaerophilus nitritogenes TaxID=2498136 RepID=UPI00101DBFEA|nr:DegV family protein [Anaerophilus nitritogenes]
MKPIKIMTTSLADVPKELAKEYDITILPLCIRFGEEEFKDGVDLHSEEFFQRLKDTGEVSQSSQIPPSIFIKEMKTLLEKGYQVILVNGSSKVSGTHQSSIMAQNEIGNEDITIIDTMALSYGCGMIVVEAAKMVKEGKSKEEIINRIEEMKDKVDHIFSVDTLDYLQKGGRLSATKATIGKILNVKPILTIQDGIVEPFDKVRGSKKIIPRMIELAQERGLKKGSEYICVAHGGNKENFKKLKEEIVQVFETENMIEMEIGCTIGTYTGPGFLAIIYIKNE